MEDLYVKTKVKKRIDKNTYTYEEVTSDKWEFDYGRLIPFGYVIFDFDEQPYIDKIVEIIKNSNLKCKLLKTTRGIQILFKTNRNDITNNNKQYNWLGLKCDVKGVGLNENGKICYQCIKVDGNTREEIAINHNVSEGLEVLDYAHLYGYIKQQKICKWI